MSHNIDMIIDFQYGSTGKGLIAGYLAKRGNYDTSVCSFSTNAGHTYIDGDETIMTQQLPTSGVISKTVKNILIGPGAAIDAAVLIAEVNQYRKYLVGKKIIIHPQAAVVFGRHADFEREDGRTKMGSTSKGVGEAYIERIRRKPNANTVGIQWGRDIFDDGEIEITASEEVYREILDNAQSVIVEGAQGFSLSLYHGQYPYVTSRDVTPWQIAADCALPYRWAPYIKVIGTLRTYPIRVNNRDGSSGPCYPDQLEMVWENFGIAPELTTVTKLPRRIFTFSQQQLSEALFHCGGYWETRLFLNFCNYIEDPQELFNLVAAIETPRDLAWNPAKIAWLGFGPQDSHIQTRTEFEVNFGLE